MPPGPRQLHACAGLALPSGIGQQPQPLATRTVCRLLKTRHGSCAAANGDRPAAALTAEELLHANEDYTNAREGRSGHDGGAGAAAEEEEVIVFAPPPAAPDGRSARARGRSDGEAVDTFRRHLRPYEEEDYSATAATVTAAAADAAATAVFAEGVPDSAAEFPSRRGRESAAELSSSVWDWSAERAAPRPHLSAGDDQMAQAEGESDGDTSEYRSDTRASSRLSLQVKRCWEANPAPATRAASTRGFDGRCKAVSAVKTCVAVAGVSRAPYASAEEDTRPSPLLLLPSASSSARRGDATPAMLRFVTERCGRRESDVDDDALFSCITTTRATFATIDNSAREDGRSRRSQGALVEREVRSTVSASDLQLVIPGHFSVQQGGDGADDGEMLRDRLLTTAPSSSSGRRTAALTHGDSGKFSSDACCSIAPRYRRHARYMAMRDLWSAPSPTASLSPTTSSTAFLQLFASSPLSHSAVYEADAEATSRMWSIIMAYYAAHHAPQAPRRTPL
ncbi:hypothetical protein LSCM4_07354 [Leishmania orientalis]|uniref:Uncharacterized protein n=1 Tax=Leishmania orientalis TaxID=2249476 RepID=A0A836KTI9_9TRYP|nr:hypothetical protein LSCM4_07354 [Leishmania orientalis]